MKFAENWKIKKIAYGASLGFDFWNFTDKEDIIIKNLLKDFNGISTREEGSINLIQQHLGINSTLVLDPTLLIDKHYYLDIIKDYHCKRKIKKEFIFIYNVVYSQEIINTFKKAVNIFDFDYYYFELNSSSLIEDFIYYMYKSNAVITNSYHGTIFSIIFNKPFITIYNKNHAIERFNSLRNIFGVNDRIFEIQEKIDLFQLIKPLNINYELLNKLRLRSINFLKNHLENKDC